jgi:hypothetical protein
MFEVPSFAASSHSVTATVTWILMTTTAPGDTAVDHREESMKSGEFCAIKL